MARSIAFIAIASICCLSLVRLASCSDFIVTGRVYCDTCRAGFETNLTTYISGVPLKIECEDREGDHPKVVIDGVTDETGTYQIPVAGEHEDDICEVMVTESPMADCNELSPNRNRARVLLAKNSGMPSRLRYANSIGFLKKEPLPECGPLLQELLAE
ncbi:major pollen allergen Lol p 11-like [Nymphaea colorata]|nr:major pollen allergen Lol p 11-like [Nymphaea colorata]